MLALVAKPRLKQYVINGILKNYKTVPYQEILAEVHASVISFYSYEGM